MIEHSFSRTEHLLGKDALVKLSKSTITVFGIGGVGSFATEALVRSGIGKLILVDGDVVCASNINRQIHATTKTIGRPKVLVMQERIWEINPHCKVAAYHEYYRAGENVNPAFFNVDYIIDAIDDLNAKTDLIFKAYQQKTCIISAMGAANKLDPTKFEIADIFQTNTDPICRILRKNLRTLDVQKLKVVYSKEQPVQIHQENLDHKVLGSISFVPSTMGLLLAGEVIKDIIATNA